MGLSGETGFVVGSSVLPPGYRETWHRRASIILDPWKSTAGSATTLS